MKKTLLTAMACVLALGLSASTASALAIGDADPNYLGSATPSSGNAEDEVFYIDYLLGMALSDTDVIDPPPSPPNTLVTFVRSDNPCVGCVEPAEEPNFKDETGDVDTIDVTGWSYLVAKYGNTSHVWYVGDLSGEVDVPLNDGSQGGGQSHVSLYGQASVPDGGATAGLLGLAMLGLGYLRRRIS